MVLDFRFFFVLTLTIVCGGIALRDFKKIWKTIELGRDESLWDRISERLGLVLKNVIGHGKLLKDPWPGLFHAFIFFGFITLTIGTGEHVIEGFVHGFSLSFLGPIYSALAFLQDSLQWFVVAAVLYFLTRRLITHPKRLPRGDALARDGLIVLLFTGGHMIGDIFAFVFLTLAGDPHAHGSARPWSSALAQLVGTWGVSPETAHTLGWVFWGVHIATVYGFLMYIPHSKHLHIITGGPNVFFSRLKHRGTFNPINFADETVTSYGVGKLTQFSWKDLLDVYSCTACGRCNEFCPTATTDKPLKPMKLIQDIKHYSQVMSDELQQKLAAAPDKAARDAIEPSKPLISEESGLSFETIWACTTCKACVEACPVMIEHVDKIVDMRRHMVLMEGNMPAELQATMKNWETQSNPWGMAPDSRDEWARGLGVKSFAENPKAEYLFYVGCAGSFNDRNKKISTAFVKILQKAGVDFAILGKEELCNGETARRAGNEYLAKAMIDANIDVLKRYEVKKILATCPHCFNTLKNEYPDFGFKAESVQHHTDFIDELIRQGKLVPQPGHGDQEIRVAFHDSCYLGRYNEVYEAPRNVLKAMGKDVIEMPRNRSKGLCCGAGGARMWMEEKIGKRINVERVDEALETQPQVIAAGCPYCQVMLSDGVTGHGKQDQVKVLDVAEIVAAKI